MDLTTLKKKVSVYVSEKGYVKGITDDVLYEILIAWEQWTGSSKDFYRSLGLSAAQISPMLGRAKKLKREGRFGEGEFKQVVIDPAVVDLTSSGGPCLGAEITWTNGRVIRFSGVDMLMEFLKKSA
jgi:hypothetical protein